MRSKIILAGVLLLVLVSSLALAFTTTGNPDDTATGTLIQLHGYDNTVDFLNLNATPEPTAYVPSTIEVLVTTEAGFSFSAVPALPYNQYSTPGVPVTYEVGVTNEGNADIIFMMDKSSIIYTGGSSNWGVTFINTLDAESAYIDTLLADNSDIFFSFVITPSTIEAESPDSSTGTVELTADNDNGYTTAGTPEYWGVNLLSYGGFAVSVEVAQVTIQAPVMTLSRTAIINAPTAYTGGANDAVPGAVITYIINYSNTGGGNATDVVIVDKVPPDTQGYHVNKTGAQTNVTITAEAGTGSGWMVYRSSAEAPSFVYGDQTDWTFMGTLEAGQDIYDSGATLTIEATFIKWEKPSVQSEGDEGTLTWGVTIQ